jgi:hypothetical protein
MDGRSRVRFRHGLAGRKTVRLSRQRNQDNAVAQSVPRSQSTGKRCVPTYPDRAARRASARAVRRLNAKHAARSRYALTSNNLVCKGVNAIAFCTSDSHSIAGIDGIGGVSNQCPTLFHRRCDLVRMAWRTVLLICQIAKIATTTDPVIIVNYALSRCGTASGQENRYSHAHAVVHIFSLQDTGFADVP